MRLTERCHAALAGVVDRGETVVDATVGNGHDTLFLARLVGPKGRVYGFDIQDNALDATRRRLQETNDVGIAPVTLVQMCHSQLAANLSATDRGRIGGVVFNLGYLPGANHQVVTHTVTTLAAIRAAMGVLRPGGIVTVLGYPGHPGGREEVNAIEALIANDTATWSELGAVDHVADSPRLFVARRAFDYLFGHP